MVDFRGLANENYPLIIHVRLGDYKEFENLDVFNTSFENTVMDSLKVIENEMINLTEEILRIKEVMGLNEQFPEEMSIDNMKPQEMQTDNTQTQ
jgi:hypothetical protein